MTRSNPFIELSNKVAETVFRLKDISLYKDLRYLIKYDPSTTPRWEKQNIILKAKSQGSTLRHQCYYLPEQKRIISIHNLTEALADPSISLTIDQVGGEIKEKFGPKTKS